MAKFVSKSAMPAKLKEKWLVALRSGKYKQTKECLERVNQEGEAIGHCCLGVLCRTAKFKGEKLKEQDTDFYDSEGGSTATELTYVMLKKVGLTEDDQKRLIRMNDGHTHATDKPMKQQSFKQIANWIEKNINIKETKKKAA